VDLRYGLGGASLDLVVGQRAERVGDDDQGESLGAQGRALDLRFMREGRGNDDCGRDATCL